MSTDEEAYESVLLVIKECYVYRIPPRATSRGYKASDWDVTQFLWQGRLRVIAKGVDAFINLEDSTTGELFAVCPYKLDGSTVEAVMDSSRYFVLTLVDPGSGKKAFIGLGFPERSMSFDFNVALQDHVKQVKKEKEATNKPTLADTGPKVDYSLKDDQKIKISIGRIGGVKKPKSTTTSGNDTFVLLPPPPSTASASATSIASKSIFNNAADDPFASSAGDFGDFVGASSTEDPALTLAFSNLSVGKETAGSADEEWADFSSFNAGSDAKTSEDWTKF